MELKESRLIVLKPLLDEDIPLFEKWLDKEYIFKRLCPDGEEQRKAWLDEVTNKDGKYDFLTHFMVYYNNHKIGYCLYADCFFLKDLEEEGHDFKDLYGDVAEINHTYEIGYLIGEEEYLNKGISKIVIQQLEEKIIKLGGREISANPSEENNFSVKALLSNGFKKKGNGDYRKTILSANDDMRTKIINLEKQALELWNNGNPDGFIDLSADDVVYIDPAFESKLEGKKALEDYYNSIRGKIKIDQYEMINPTVQLSAEVAVLTYNYEAHRDGMIFKMSCTEVYKLDSANQWKIIHTHWSFVQPANK